jgi:hypothetical protein
MWGLPRSGNYPKDADDGTDGGKPLNGRKGGGNGRVSRPPKPFTRTEASVPKQRGDKPSRSKQPKE